MGSGIFHYLLDYSYPLRWLVSEQADVGKLLHSVDKRILRSVKAGIRSEEEGERRFESLKISTDKEILRDCTLVIEAIPEQVQAKREVFSSLDAILPAESILATNSSSIRPSVLWFDEKRDPFFIGIHFFYPVALKETVEVMVTRLNAPTMVDKVKEFLTAIGKRPLILNERQGFILNRLFLDVQNEAWRIVEQGAASVEEIDRIVSSRLFPFGVFDFMDSVGIDTMRASVEQYIADYPHRDHYTGLLEQLISLEQEGRLGIKSGRGFYRYTGSRRELPEPDDCHATTGTGTSESEIAEHLRNTWLNAARRLSMRSGCTLVEMNDAIKEYFDVERGPFG